jgi:hypothetical protein
VTLNDFDRTVLDRLAAPRGFCRCGKRASVIAMGTYKQDFGLEATCALHWPAASQSWRELHTMAVWRDGRWETRDCFSALPPVSYGWDPDGAAALEREARHLLVAESIAAGFAVSDRATREAAFAVLARTSLHEGAALAYDWIRAGLFLSPPPDSLLARVDRPAPMRVAPAVPLPATPWWKYREMAAPQTVGEELAHGFLRALGWVIARSFVLRVVVVLLR